MTVDRLIPLDGPANFRDRTGLENLHRVGVDNVTFETDYPHTDSTWPHTKKIATDMLAALDDESVRKIVRGNAIKLFGLDGLAP